MTVDRAPGDEAIHPCIDGDGRIGWLLLALLLVHWNLLWLRLLYLSAYFERHRQTYYDLLMAVSACGKWRDWLDSLFESPLLTIPMAQGRIRGMSHSAQHKVGKPVQAGSVRQVSERACWPFPCLLCQPNIFQVGEEASDDPWEHILRDKLGVYSCFSE